MRTSENSNFQPGNDLGKINKRDESKVIKKLNQTTSSKCKYFEEQRCFNYGTLKHQCDNGYLEEGRVLEVAYFAALRKHKVDQKNHAFQSNNARMNKDI